MKKLVLALIAMLLVFSFSGCVETFDLAPNIKSGDFPFALEYELNGETYIVEDTVVCTFKGYASDTNNFLIFGHPSPRVWDETVSSDTDNFFGIVLLELDNNTESVLTNGRTNFESYVFLDYGSAEYYMGDHKGSDYQSPQIKYFEKYYDEEIGMPNSKITSLSDEELEEYFGIKIIRFEFSEPIENTFE